MNAINSIPPNAIPIALAFTAYYVVPAATTIISVLKNADPEDRFHFICLMSENLSEEIKSNLRSLDFERAHFSFINMSGRLENIYIDEKYTVAASYRLLLPELLPKHEKIIYMDCDIIVQNDIAKLFRETDLKDHYLAGVREATLPQQEEHLFTIGCTPGEYINSGFLLMNLKALRENDMVDKFLKASEDESLEFPDQDVLNMLCKGHILALPPIWNSIRTFLLPQYKNAFLNYYTESEWNEVQSRGNIHYTGPKPWGNFTVKFDLWWQYYSTIPFKIRTNYPTNKKVFLLYKVYSNPLGGALLQALQKGYRYMKGNHG